MYGLFSPRSHYKQFTAHTFVIHTPVVVAHIAPVLFSYIEFGVSFSLQVATGLLIKSHAFVFVSPTLACTAIHIYIYIYTYTYVLQTYMHICNPTRSQAYPTRRYSRSESQTYCTKPGSRWSWYANIQYFP